MKDPAIKIIKDKWLDMKKLSEKEEALLFSRIEKLEEELQRRAEIEWNETLSEIVNEKTSQAFKPTEKAVKCPNCHHLFTIYISPSLPPRIP